MAVVRAGCPRLPLDIFCSNSLGFPCQSKTHSYNQQKESMYLVEISKYLGRFRSRTGRQLASMRLIKLGSLLHCFSYQTGATWINNELRRDEPPVSTGSFESN
jgi:hypothetical protein